MRPAAAMVICLVLSATAIGAEGMPSEQALADMGLSELQILSDNEAAAVRGMGFSGFETYRNSIKLFHKEVKTFHRAVKGFHKQVKKFERHTSKMKHHRPSGMKPPKMSHGGKLW